MDGRARSVPFNIVGARKTRGSIPEPIKALHDCLYECWVDPAIAMAAMYSDLLYIHPVHDRSGRVSRLW